MSFATTLRAFCDELRGTFPELRETIDRAATLTPEQFWRMWSGALPILLERNSDALFTDRKGFLVGAVRIVPTVWAECSAGTQTAIWRYLRTMVLEAAMELSLEGLSAETVQTLHAILMAERMESGGADAEAAAAEMLEEGMAHLSPLMDRLKGMLGNFMDVSGLGDLPELPEHLRNGRIARLAEDLAKQFTPEDFGIDPALLAGDNVEEILQRLAGLYQRDPTRLLAGAKKMADKIRRQIEGGSLDREALVAEAKEFVALFREHPTFKDVLGKLEEFTQGGGLGALFGAGGGGGGGAPSDRLRAAQERLRKKMEARKPGGAGRK